MKVKLKSTIDIPSLELREPSAFERLEKDTFYDVLLIEMYEGNVKFISKIRRLIDILEKRSFKILPDVKLEFA